MDDALLELLEPVKSFVATGIKLVAVACSDLWRPVPCSDWKKMALSLSAQSDKPIIVDMTKPQI